MTLHRTCAARLRSGNLAFTLLEIALSIAILGGVMVGVLMARARALEAHAAAREIMTCTRLCASQVAALRAGLIQAGSGEFLEPGGYTWQVIPMDLAEEMPQGLKAYRVSVIGPAHALETAATVTVWLAPNF